MKTLVRTTVGASLALSLFACSTQQPAPSLAPEPASVASADNAALQLRAPTLPGDRLSSHAASAVQSNRAKKVPTAAIVLGVAAAAVVLIILAAGGGSAY
jgi:hypothetical protein